MSPNDGSPEMDDIRRHLDRHDKDFAGLQAQQVLQFGKLASLEGDMRVVRVEMTSLVKSSDSLVTTVAALTATVTSMTGQMNRWRGGLYALLICGPIVGGIVGALSGLLMRWLLFGAPLSK